MKAENMMDAIGTLDEGLLAESLPKKHRNFRPLIAVAAIAAALAVTIGAGQFLLSGWQMTYEGLVDGEQYLEETQEKYPNLSPEEVVARAERYDGTYAFTMESQSAVPELTDAALKHLYALSESSPEQLEQIPFSSLDTVEEVLDLRLLHSTLAPTTDDVMLTVYQLYQSEASYEDQAYLVNGVHVINAVPYGFQVDVASTYHHADHPDVGVWLFRQFFTVEGHAVTYRNNMIGEPKFFTVETDHYVVDCAVGEQAAVGYFLHEGVAYKLHIQDLGERSVGHEELKETLLAVLQTLN